MTRRTTFSRARIYLTLRSAHLERAKSMSPASILYKDRRLDFDPALAEGLDLIPANGLGLLSTLIASDLDAVEVNEPLLRSALVRGAAAVVIVRAVGLLRRKRVMVVSYAIDNRDPFAKDERRGPKAAVRTFVERRLAHLVASQIDRIAYGTGASQNLYRQIMRRSLGDAQSALYPALPAPCDCAEVGANAQKDPNRVLFIGSFVARKGFPDLMAAWPEVVRRRPDSRLTIVGAGTLLEQATEFAQSHDSVDLVVDPPRIEIHQLLRNAAVLVLLSQPSPIWREQIGLPIVEGLAHGCTIIATSETGLAEWLADHAHAVVRPGADPEIVGEAIVRAIETARTAGSVLADLPNVDGRLRADEWLFDGARSDAKVGLG